LFPGVPGSNLAADGQCERSPSEGDDLRCGCWPGESCGGAAGMEHVVGARFKLGKKIGSGSFGELYLGTRLAGFLIESPTTRVPTRRCFVLLVVPRLLLMR
jgi:hypothetical protein